MEKISPNLYHASIAKISNVWVIGDSSGNRFLIDTGHPVERATLMYSLMKAGIRGPGDLTGILLTHRHSDHAGNAAWFRKLFGARVFCHKDDALILKGDKPAGEMKQGKGPFYTEFLCGIEDRFPAECAVDDVYEEGPWKWGFHVVPVPGHTEGSVMLYHEPSQTLFSGDAILVGTPLFRASKKLRLAVPEFSIDPEACHRSVRKFLKQLPKIETLCSGHGPPLTEGAQQRLLKLLH